jgi:RNA polymerase sigma factor (sigma-70 family)
MDSNTLIQQCLKNNRMAQKSLYDQYANAMLGVCYRYTKSLADAEDVLQEGFIKVFHNLQHYRKQGTFEVWIRRIMVNTAIDYLRRHSRYRNELNLDHIVMHPVSNEQPELMLDTKELVEAIRELPTGYQAVFNLVAIEGYNHIEAGNLLGISEQTSRSQYSRARATLIKKLQSVSEQQNLQRYVR